MTLQDHSMLVAFDFASGALTRLESKSLHWVITTCGTTNCQPIIFRAEQPSIRAQLALGRAALAQRDFAVARDCFQRALASPRNLSEAKHLLANQSDIHYGLGRALAGLGDKKYALEHWRSAATCKGDFQEVSVRAFSEMTHYSALSWEKLGQPARAKKLFRDLPAFAQKLRKAQAKIDYFATSLPTMRLFDGDPQFRQETTARLLQAQDVQCSSSNDFERPWTG
jgi:tetratricopeptide (TPR) repeat protein